MPAKIDLWNSLQTIIEKMIYPDNFERKIGFDQVRELILSHCLSSQGQEYVRKMRFSVSASYLSRIHRQTAEFSKLLSEHPGFPTQHYYDMRPELQRIAIEGAYFSQETLFDLRDSLETVFDIRNFILQLDKEEFPSLYKLIEHIHLDAALLRSLQHIIDDKGEIRSRASAALADIRMQLQKKEGKIGGMIRASLQQAKKAGWTDPDAEVVLRNGRLLVPVNAGSKRKLKGFIHDQSSTGQTVYIEPVEVFEINNAIRELKNEERTEIIRILKNFTAEIRPYIPELRLAYQMTGIVDFIRAKSLFAISFDACSPKMTGKSIIRWKKAVHPLLLLAHKKQNKAVVPLDIELHRKQKILIISGPNAGGKSVALKTIGLLQYMFQCGIPVPVREDSVFGIFHDIFVDIGDEQSIENDLSTYSSHLKNMATFIENAGERSLFLIDEFGTGTEPQLGGAIAEAVLEELYRKKAFGVLTTHYANLKLLAGKYEAIENAAMLFDNKILAPVYQLVIGKPGSSFAFEIASKTGLPDSVLNAARHKINQKHLDFDRELQQLEVEKKQIEKEKINLSFQIRQRDEEREKYQRLLAKLQAQKTQFLQEAQKEAQAIVARSNRLIENTIAGIRKVQADKEKTKELRKKLQKDQQKLLEKTTSGTPGSPRKTPEISPASPKKKPIEAFQPAVGDFVKVKDSDIVGEVIRIENTDVTISFQQIKLKLPVENLESIEEEVAFKRLYGGKSGSNRQLFSKINEKALRFKPRLDIRGKRGEEALDIVQHFIDDAIVLKATQVEIVHGKGDGILRSLIRDYLRGIPQITSFGDEHIERGGSGITVVRF